MSRGEVTLTITPRVPDLTAAFVRMEEAFANLRHESRVAGARLSANFTVARVRREVVAESRRIVTEGLAHLDPKRRGSVMFGPAGGGPMVEIGHLVRSVEFAPTTEEHPHG